MTYGAPPSHVKTPTSVFYWLVYNRGRFVGYRPSDGSRLTNRAPHQATRRIAVRSASHCFPLTACVMASEFYRRLDAIPEQSNSELPTERLTGRMRDRYMARRIRMSQFFRVSMFLLGYRAFRRSGVIASSVFSFWKHMIVGPPNASLPKRFPAIRSIHVAEGYTDLPRRAPRARGVIKDHKLLGELRNKTPCKTDMSRWSIAGLQIGMSGNTGPSIIIKIWAGLSIHFLFFSRFSELLALATDALKIVVDGDSLSLSILLRSTTTDRGKAATRTPSSNPSIRCPVTDMRHLVRLRRGIFPLRK